MPTTTAVPIWVGSQEVVETPDSPKLGHDVTRFRVFRSYEGPYDQVVGNQPVRGNAFSDLPPAVLIVDVQVLKKPGNIGRLEVQAETQGPSDTNPTAPTYEVEWVEIDRPLYLHPIFAVGGAGKFALTAIDVAMIDRWEQEDDPSLRSAYQYKVPSGTTYPTGFPAPTLTAQMIGGTAYDIFTLSSNGQAYAAKRLKGIDSYRLWAPVARQTIETYGLPESNPCGLIEDPPGAIGAPSGYTYQRSAQRAVKTGRYGKWQQIQEWQGADTIDTDLYPYA